MKPVINFMGIRHLAFAVTVILTLVSLGSLAVKGLQHGNAGHPQDESHVR